MMLGTGYRGLIPALPAAFGDRRGQGVSALAPSGLSITLALASDSLWARSGGDKSMPPALGRAPCPPSPRWGNLGLAIAWTHTLQQ